MIFLAPLNMILIHRKQLSGCHTASSAISPPLILPIHILSPHVTPNLRPLLKQKTVAKLGGSVCPSCLIEMLLTKKHRLLLLSLSLNHFSSISSALVSSLLPTSPEESTTTTLPSSPPSSSPRSGGGVENKRHKRPTHCQIKLRDLLHVLPELQSGVQSFCTQSNVCSRTENRAVERNQIKAFCLCHKLQENILSSL